jgi:hypothetical protein
MSLSPMPLAAASACQVKLCRTAMLHNVSPGWTIYRPAAGVVPEEAVVWAPVTTLGLVTVGADKRVPARLARCAVKRRVRIVPEGNCEQMPTDSQTDLS